MTRALSEKMSRRWKRFVTAAGGQKYVATRLGYTRAAVYRWAIGKHRPDVAARNKIVRLATRLGIASPVQGGS